MYLNLLEKKLLQSSKAVSSIKTVSFITTWCICFLLRSVALLLIGEASGKPRTRKTMSIFWFLEKKISSLVYHNWFRIFSLVFNVHLWVTNIIPLKKKIRRFPFISFILFNTSVSLSQCLSLWWQKRVTFHRYSTDWFPMLTARCPRPIPFYHLFNHADSAREYLMNFNHLLYTRSMIRWSILDYLLMWILFWYLENAISA